MRRFVGPREWARLQGRADRRHGFGVVGAVERRGSRGTARYDDRTPRPGVRFVSIDTVSEAGGPDGDVDHPQYRWLARPLEAAERRRELIIVYGPHTLETMETSRPDEHAPRCGGGVWRAAATGAARRPSNGDERPRAAFRSLFLRFPNVILFVSGA